MSRSKSSLETFYQCPKAFKYTYIDGFEPVYRSKEVGIGLAVHALLEGKPQDEALGLCTDDLDRAKAKLMVECDRREPLPEHTKESPFTTKHGTHGIFDGVSFSHPRLDLDELPTKVTLIEHKTTGSDIEDGMYWERTRTDWQVGMYLLAAQELYGVHDVEMIYNVFRVPALRHKRGESDASLIERIGDDLATNQAKYYARATIRWHSDSLARLEQDLLDTGALISHCEQSGNFPRSRRCQPFPRSSCGFKAHCFEGQPLADGTLYQVRKRR